MNELFMTCKACSNYYQQPVVLPCGHAFCSGCLSQAKTCLVCNKKYSQVPKVCIEFSKFIVHKNDNQIQTDTVSQELHNSIASQQQCVAVVDPLQNILLNRRIRVNTCYGFQTATGKLATIVGNDGPFVIAVLKSGKRIFIHSDDYDFCE